MLSEALLEQEHLDAREDPAAVAKLFEFAERAKRDLSSRTSTIVQIDHLVVQPYAARSITVGLRRATVERAVEPLVDQTLAIVKDVVARAGLELEDVDDIVLVGGQSRAPLVRTKVEALFQKQPLDDVDPEEAVALGAARYAASLDSVDDIVLIDALPLSIGVGLPGGRFKQLLARDVRLPTKRTYNVRTTRDDQKEYELAVFQGESEFVADNEPLGVLCLEGLPKGPRGTVVVEVTIGVDAECLLEIGAREPTTGRHIVARMVTRHTTEELRTRLGLPPTPSHEELERRRRAIHDRPKKVWRWITGLFKKR
jgi:molecular chaperone DnaK (HSP70)